jgi:ATP-dependent RNA helicase RhlE
VSFEGLGLVPPLLRALTEAGYREPTPIQREAIGPALERRDLIGCAQTGTGKTAAFALPILQHIDATAGEDPELRALVLSPTRELAAQIGESFATYGRHLDVWHTVVFGGVADKPQIQELRDGVDVLVATPGRLLDLMGRGHVDLRAIDVFVLDEADRMLDMGFLPDVERVLAALPRKRQNLLFSATMPPEIRRLAAGFLHDPVSVGIAVVSQPVEKIDQRVLFVEKGDKPARLLELVRGAEVERCLVFTRTKHGANRVVQYLHKQGIRAAAIHGNKSQGARTRALDGFKRGDLHILVATDLAARGLDVDGITHVINFDLPNVPETYVHRIGRTARAGASGIAISMCSGEEREFLDDIEDAIGREIERVGNVPPRASARPRPVAPPRGGHRRSGRGGGGGRRRSR